MRKEIHTRVDPSTPLPPFFFETHDLSVGSEMNGAEARNIRYLDEDDGSVRPFAVMPLEKSCKRKITIRVPVENEHGIRVEQGQTGPQGSGSAQRFVLARILQP